MAVARLEMERHIRRNVSFVTRSSSSSASSLSLCRRTQNDCESVAWLVACGLSICLWRSTIFFFSFLLTSLGNVISLATKKIVLHFTSVHRNFHQNVRRNERRSSLYLVLRFERTCILKLFHRSIDQIFVSSLPYFIILHFYISDRCSNGNHISFRFYFRQIAVKDNRRPITFHIMQRRWSYQKLGNCTLVISNWRKKTSRTKTTSMGIASHCQRTFISTDSSHRTLQRKARNVRKRQKLRCIHALLLTN